MDLTHYRESGPEKERTADLLQLIKLVSNGEGNVLDVGARDGHFSKLLTQYFGTVTALDLEKPTIDFENVCCVKGDITCLEFKDDYFDLVLCAEVLEHIPPELLDRACSELSRVSKKYLLIGVPYVQDIRVGRTTCYSCGKKNPPWGHVNSFNLERLKMLFSSLTEYKRHFVGVSRSRTNFLSTLFMDLAGNPYGVYAQEELCIHCGKKLIAPPDRSFPQKIATKIAFYLQAIQGLFLKSHPNWIHILFHKSKE